MKTIVILTCVVVMIACVAVIFDIEYLKETIKATDKNEKDMLCYLRSFEYGIDQVRKALNESEEDSTFIKEYVLKCAKSHKETNDTITIMKSDVSEIRELALLWSTFASDYLFAKKHKQVLPNPPDFSKKVIEDTDCE